MTLLIQLYQKIYKEGMKFNIWTGIIKTKRIRNKKDFGQKKTYTNTVLKLSVVEGSKSRKILI